MRLRGTVQDVVDTSAFAAIGIKQDSLVHSSKMAHPYSNGPFAVLSMGDAEHVTVITVHLERRRISLRL